MGQWRPWVSQKKGGSGMGKAAEQAVALILSGDRELRSILAVTAKMSLCSSLLALALGVP